MPTAKPQRKITFESNEQLKQAQDDANNAGMSLSAWFLTGRGYSSLEIGVNFKINNPAKLPLRAVVAHKRASARQKKP